MTQQNRDDPLLLPSEIDAVFAPIDVAATLPPRAFIDSAFFEAERKAIFFGGWAALCLVDIVPQVGDAAPLVFLGAPLLVVRRSTTEVRVFHNLCPYDQCPVLLEAVSQVDTLSSAYHGWKFDLDGRLVAAPYWNGGEADSAEMVRRAERDLSPVACGLFGKVVFVNVSGRAGESFDDYISPLRKRFGNLDFEALEVGRNPNGSRAITVLNWRGNWKTHHENACINVYHESTVHFRYRVSDEVPRVTKDRTKRYEEIIDVGLRGLAFRNEAVGDTYDSMGLSELKTKDGRRFEDNIIVSLYPSLYASLIGQHLHLTIVTPNDQHSVQVMTASYFDAEIATSPDYNDLRSMVEAGWAVAGEEDAAIVASIHAARFSPAAAPGYYSSFWDRPHYTFTQQVVRDLGIVRRGEN